MLMHAFCASQGFLQGFLVQVAFQVCQKKQATIFFVHLLLLGLAAVSVPNLPHCKDGDSQNPGPCTSCNDGFFLSGDSCAPCLFILHFYSFMLLKAIRHLGDASSQCLTCDATGNMCETCHTGYFMTMNNKCQRCTF